MLRISFILSSNPCDGTNVRQWVQDVRISSFLNHIHIWLKEKRVEKSLFFSSTLHPASFYHDLWDDLWCQESSSSCHDHTRARFSHQQQQPPLPCNYGRWLGAQFLCKKKSFPNYARTKRCACNSEVISSVKAKLEMTKYFHLQMGLFLTVVNCEKRYWLSLRYCQS